MSDTTHVRPQTQRDARWWMRQTAFGLLHLTPLGAIWTGMDGWDLLLCFVLYGTRMFFITAGFHRYFSHRAFKMNRFWQFWMAFFAQTSGQRGVLWWAAHHRHHHRFSDMPEDIHSPHYGFWYSHVGWILDPANTRTKHEDIKDFAKYPELVWLDRLHALPAILLGVACFLLGGGGALFGGFFLSTVLLYHGTFTVNSLTHLIGSRRYVTRDTSRNNFLIALITCGEGWHNNHHHYPSTAKAGFFWYEIDASYYALKVLSWFRIVTDLRPLTEEAKTKNLVSDSVPDIGMFQANWEKATAALNHRKAALTEKTAQTRVAYAERKQAVEKLVEETKSTAEEISRMAKIAGEQQ